MKALLCFIITNDHLQHTWKVFVMDAISNLCLINEDAGVLSFRVFWKNRPINEAFMSHFEKLKDALNHHLQHRPWTIGTLRDSDQKVLMFRIDLSISEDAPEEVLLQLFQNIRSGAAQQLERYATTIDLINQGWGVDFNETSGTCTLKEPRKSYRATRH